MVTAVLTAAQSDEGFKRSKRALNDYSVEVGQRIIQARKELGLTQEELAELAGVSQRSMQAYETGEVIPYRKMREIAEVVQRSTSWLLHGHEGDEDKDETIERLERKVDDLTKLVRSMNRRLGPGSSASK